MTNSEKALQMHEQWNGKLETAAKAHVNSREDLAIAYTPGVAEPCKVIAKDPEAAYKYTIKSNTVAVVSDGSAVLGLGNIGALAAMPVMEGKAVLFKEFGGVNAVPICLDTQDTEEIIKTVVNIAPAFGGINLEDISAPRCFEIEERLKELLNKVSGDALTEEEQENKKNVDELVAKFEAAMDDDFNTADAVSAIFELVKLANSTANEESTRAYAELLAGTIAKLSDVLGIITERKAEVLDSEVEELIAARQQARKEKNFALADEIRQKLLDMGIVLEDTREGVKWKRA